MKNKVDKTIEKQIEEWANSDKCTCSLCARGRKFARIIGSLPIVEDKKWMLAFYDNVISIEEEHGMLEYHNKEQQKKIELLQAVANRAIDHDMALDDGDQATLIKLQSELFSALQDAIKNGAME